MAFRGFQRSVGTQFGAAFPVAGDHILLPRGIPYNSHGRRAPQQHHHYVYQQRALRTHSPPPPPQWGGDGSGFPVAGEYIRTTAAQQLLPPQNYYSYYVHQDFSINPSPPQRQFDSVREDETLILNGTTVHPRQQRQQHAIPRNNNNGGGGGFGLSESQIEKCVKIIKINNSCPNYYIDNRGGATATATAGEEEGSEVCAICLDDLYCPDQSNNNHNIIGVLDCKHVYHSDCIRRWLHVKNFCPMCKSVAHS